MYGKNITLTMLVVTGLLFMAGSGCSDDDKNKDAMAQALKAELDKKQAELDCKVKVLQITCTKGDTKCETDKATALSACNAISGSSTSTSTSTSTSSSTSTNTSSGGADNPTTN